MKMLSVQVQDELLEAIDDLAAYEQLSKDVVVQRALREALRQADIRLAVDQHRKAYALEPQTSDEMDVAPESLAWNKDE